MKEIEITIRPYDKEIDDPYIYSTWRKYAWYSPEKKITLPKNEFFTKKTEEIKKILFEGVTKIACFKNDPRIFVGVIVTNERKIEALFVKKDYLKEGIDELLKKSVKENLDE